MSAISGRTLRLSDRRQLSYVRWNPGGRHPVLFCHGTPGSRLFRPSNQSLLTEMDIDLVTVDRPGYGKSTPQAGRALLSWTKDVLALARELGWGGRFSVAGMAGGGPHALACGRMIPHRIKNIGLVSSFAPFWPGAVRGMLPSTRRDFWLADWAPWMLRLSARRMKSSSARVRFLAKLRRELPECDRGIVIRPDVAFVLVESTAEAFATEEMAREMVLLRQSWGFSLREVRARVELWHGEIDRTVPVSHAHQLAKGLTNAHLTLIPNAGHYLIFDHWRAVLSKLIADVPERIPAGKKRA